MPVVFVSIQKIKRGTYEVSFQLITDQPKKEPIENINIFTPNNDGTNDFFVPINLNQYPNPHLLVFNRWGELVYENSNYQNDWSGTHYKSGEELKEGIYYYLIDPKSTKYGYEKISLEKNGISGKVQLIR